MATRHRRAWPFQSDSDLELGKPRSCLQLTENQLQVLSTVFDKSKAEVEAWPGCKAYILYLTHELDALRDVQFEPFWIRLSIQVPISSADTLAFAASLARVYVTAPKPGSSLDEILDILLAKHDLNMRMLPASDVANARHIGFYVLLTLTTFMKPTIGAADSGFTIEISQRTAAFRGGQSIDCARRPISNLLRGYGPLLPTYEQVTRGIDSVESNTIRVSSLNYASLKMMAKVNIEWTPVLSSHLVFRPMSRTLMLYKFPTFCALHAISGKDLVFDK